MFKNMKIKALCRPAKFYLYLSLVGVAFSLLQNLSRFDNSQYKCGSFSVSVPSVMLIFVFKLMYIGFWAYVINLICKDDNKRLAWLLVLFPFLLMFVILGLLMLTGGRSREGFEELDEHTEVEGLEGRKPIGEKEEMAMREKFVAEAGQADAVKENYGGLDTSSGAPPPNGASK